VDKPPKSLEGGLPGLPVESNSPLLPSQLNAEPSPAKKDQPKPKEGSPSTLPKSERLLPDQSRTDGKWPSATSLRFALQQPPTDAVIGLADGDVSQLRGRSGVHLIGVTPAEPQANRIQPTAYAPTEPALQAAAVDRQNGVPSVALKGYCIVELIRNGRWAMGDLRWTVVHQGWIYRFSGPAQRQQFLANPEFFVPVNSGNDPVLSADKNITAAGQLAHCTTYNGRLYMFSNAATQAQFVKSPQRYMVIK
jgi:YHS domain-containing protein